MDDPAQLHAERLSWEMGSWTAIEVRAESEFVNKTKQAASEYGSYRLAAHSIETAAGQRMFEEVIRPDEGGVHTKTNYTDGKLAAQHIKREGARQSDQIAIKQSFGTEDSGSTHRVEPFEKFYVGLMPLPEALPSATYLGEGRHLGRACDRFLFANVPRDRRTLDFVYWLDRDNSIPLRVETFRNEQDRAEDRPSFVWTVESTGEFEGHTLPRTFSGVRYRSDDDGRREPWYRIDGTVTEVLYNRSYPDSTFWPTPSEFTTVLDYVKGTVTPPERHLIEAQSDDIAPIVATAPNPRLSPSMLLIVAGLVAVIFGAWLARRVR